ncbi:sirohydrochlorin chelatase [Catenulispora sp. NF23]|uniref:Sirohydrochlorin chelatase n=1 Tax=Catenulispora pinistramenti TaxID=2705254 RepID=A0ABS5KK28_9ACTN|nr:sirohydrochlorin chelatase [Catenulispora pinistramenti]MBS2533010.1 sirohydrochlorin chelatase [Catenulispora pinistramenti]MBS2546525.1 sirohydrochlorin chelatase [Catenulispora pinistramenti]
MKQAEAMLAVAHGSRDPRHREVITALVDTVRAQRPELRVETAFLDHCGPTTARALQGLVRDGYQHVKVVPLLLNSAYHVRQDIPAAVLAAHESLPPRWRSVVATPVLAEPLGPHPLVLAGLERRLREAGVWPGDEEASVVLAWAGSSDRVAAAAVDELAEGWQRSGWERVVPVPAVGDQAGAAVRALRSRGARRVVVAPYFLAPGLLADRIRGSALRAGADAVADELGNAPEVASAVLARFDGARTRCLAHVA